MTVISNLRTATLVAISASLLSACGGSTTSTFAPASYDTLDSLADGRASRISPFPTTAGQRPSGTVTYNGELRITPALSGTTQDYLGRAQISVGFSDNRLTGSVSNLTSDRGFVTSESLSLGGGQMSRNAGFTLLDMRLTGDVADSEGNNLGFSNAIDGGVFGRDAETVQLDGTGFATNNNSRNGAQVGVTIELIAEQ